MNVKNTEMINKVIDPDLEKRDILESEIPKDVLDILLIDRTTRKNILWMTDSYEHLESTFDIKMGYTRSNLRTMRQFYLMFPICHAVSGKLTWTHYRTLITVENEAARQYYFEEAIKSKWSVRDLQRQSREDIPHLARPPKGVNYDISSSKPAIVRSFEGWLFGITRVCHFIFRIARFEPMFTRVA